MGRMINYYNGDYYKHTAKQSQIMLPMLLFMDSLCYLQNTYGYFKEVRTTVALHLGSSIQVQVFVESL